MFVFRVAYLVHVIYGYGTHTHQIKLFMAVDMDCVFYSTCPDDQYFILGYNIP